jgi:hypothetical protein
MYFAHESGRQMASSYNKVRTRVAQFVKFLSDGAGLMPTPSAKWSPAG